MIISICLLIATSGIEFHTDPVVYRTTLEIEDTINHTIETEEIFYAEFNCEIPYQELDYESAEDIIYANVIIPFKIRDLTRLDSLVDTLYRQFTLPSFSYAAKQRVSFIVQFGTYLTEGTFNYFIEILSGDKRGISEAALEITDEDYGMSDILLSSEITVDTAGTYLKKGNLRVIPRPSHSFDERFENLCFYYELYDVVPTYDTVTATYLILNREGKIVRKISRPIDKIFPSQAANCGFNVLGFEPGEYDLLISIEDDESNVLAQKETRFKISRAQRMEVSYEGMPYYDEIEYLVGHHAYDEFKHLPEEGKKRFLDKFWQKYDYYEIAERFEYADEQYRYGGKPGSKTDRGRIYIKRGEPDQIDRPQPLQLQESRPYEHWQYLNGDDYIFVDIAGTNNYVLVWTNDLDEQSQPTLYKYLPPEKRDIVH
jgi:GWxTD domain-containing protein